MVVSLMIRRYVSEIVTTSHKVLTVLVDVFNNNQVLAASDAYSNVTGNVYLGRPWGGECFIVIIYDISILTYPQTTQSKKIIIQSASYTDVRPKSGLSEHVYRFTGGLSSSLKMPINCTS